MHSMGPVLFEAAYPFLVGFEGKPQESSNTILDEALICRVGDKTSSPQ